MHLLSSPTRTVYHTHIKYLVHHNLLSSDIFCKIPRSNIFRWKKEDPGRYASFDLNLQADADFETIRHFAHNPSAKRVYVAYVRVIKMVLSVAHGQSGFHRAVKEQSGHIVQLVNRVKNIVGLKRSLRFFNISVSTFRNWSLQSMTACFESLTGKCNRVFHNQLSRPEIIKLKALLADRQFQYWPVSSIALFALRKNVLPLRLNTWYKYVNKLGLARSKPLSRKKKISISVRAKQPHQIWHADITQFVTADQVKHYIYVVIDNFSRKILSWLIAPSVKVEYRKVTISEALKNARLSSPDITLITDGGPENKLKTFLASLDPPIEHKIALVDVHYSNSLIEASFKTTKYNYLYRMDIPDGDRLRKVFPFIVDDFNNRPHVSLGGLTPIEAEQNISIDKEQLRLYTTTATEERLQYNQTHHCKQCDDQ